MSHSQSPPGSLRGKPQPLNGGAKTRAAKLDFDIDVDVDIDWDALGFGQPAQCPAARPQPSPGEEDEGPTGIYVSRGAENGEAQSAPSPDAASKRESREPPPAAVPEALPERESPPARAPAPAPDPVPAHGDGTLIMKREEVFAHGDEPGRFASGQTLVMTHQELLGRHPKRHASGQGTAGDTKLMPIEEVIGSRTKRNEGPVPGAAVPEVTDEDSGPHTKMMPIDVLMKRANAQRSWPFPGVAVQAELRDSERRRANQRAVLARVRDGWRATSFARKASLLLLPLIAAVILVRFSKLPFASKVSRTTPAAASARAARPAPAPTQLGAPAESHGRASKPPAPGAAASPSPAPVAEAPAPGTASSVLAASASAPPAPAAAASTSSTLGAPPARTAGDDPLGGRGSKGATPQRRATDAVAEGDYATAVERYRSLARQYPQVPAYREAARILEERASGARR